ncbi:hypothetical protein ACS0TY_006309 [Phlomoides rotata]
MSEYSGKGQGWPKLGKLRRVQVSLGHCMASIPARGKVGRSLASSGVCKRAWVTAWRGPATTDEMDCYMGRYSRFR